MWDNFLHSITSPVRLLSGTRKTSDIIELTSNVGTTWVKWYLTTLFDFRSQFAPGCAIRPECQSADL